MMPYERFEAWQNCHALVLALYPATKSWPNDERYGLVSQVRRAAISSAANIAEGTAKRGPRELRRYLDMSLGSLSELSYLLRVARELGYLTVEQGAELDRLRERASRLTWKLYEAVSRAT